MAGYRDLLWVGLGGFLGANTRYLVGQWVAQRCGDAFPWATLLINVSGSFLLGLLATLLAERLPGAAAAWRLSLAVGFIGAYTTFSTYELEAYKLLEAGQAGRALAYVGGSVVAGFAALLLAVRLARVGS
ncbi:MAG: fluoride efflux transporter CrcB [Fimbriimonadaceae bacterium]|nr:fluoride efflux transporter CrcB [Fimbriimonadaceae bacterium]